MDELPVLVVEDDSELREAVVETLSAHGLETLEAADGEVGIELLGRWPVGMVISDVQMSPMDGQALLAHVRNHHPDLPIVMMTAYGTVEQAVAAMHGGANDYLMKPFEAEYLVAMAEKYRLRPVTEGPIAEDPVSLRCLELVRTVATSEATVLFSGESGTGKEIYARYIHQLSPRREHAFVAINCAAIPENMLEAVLFGYEKGAFTGAQAAHPGKFEQAQGGTLLLDEVSEMDVALQAKLLRVLQEREVERLGGRGAIALDVRVIATTNRDLASEVGAGRFREDLYYRLNVFPVRLPALRDRPRDIIALARDLIRRHCRDRRPVPALSADAEARLSAHSWPGNIRELDNVIQRALILASGEEIGPQDLHLESGAALPVARASDPSLNAGSTPVETTSAPEQRDGCAGSGVLNETLRDQEFQVIVDALRREGGSRKQAAERLGISPRTLRYRMARLREGGVEFPRNLSTVMA